MTQIFNSLQAQYDNQLPLDTSGMDDAIEEKTAEIIERQGLDWLESRVDCQTWDNIVTACEAEAQAEIKQEIEDAQWEWRNQHFGENMKQLFDEAQQNLDTIKASCSSSAMSILRLQALLDAIQERVRYANIALSFAAILSIAAFMVGLIVIVGKAH